MLFHFFEPIAQFIDVKTGYFGYILIPDLERERFLFESQAMAFRTFNGRDKLVGPFLADALATACMAMDIDEALAMVEAWEGAEAMLVTIGDDGGWLMRTTAGFPELKD